ncbi:RDD family protein [Micrococcales bacterium 31B]|nr:RDD family protein [Micrococcales bacterium 31B]
MKKTPPVPSLDVWMHAAHEHEEQRASAHDAPDLEHASSGYGGFEQRFVTGDAVVLALTPTSWIMRCLAGVIDGVIMVTALIFAIIGIANLPFMNATDVAIQQIGVTLIVITTLVLYPLVMETLTRGRTVGKYVAGARVVRVDGGPITFRHAFARALVGFVEKVLTAGSLAFLACIISPRSQRLGDMAAGTLVVNTRAPKLHPMRYPVPQNLVEWVANADIRPLPHHVATSATQLVQRWDGLDPASRQSIETHLAHDLSQLVSPPPPLHAGPRDVCLAIIGERQRRDLDSLNSAMARRTRRRAIARNQEF